MPKHPGGRPRKARPAVEAVPTMSGKRFAEALAALDMTPDAFAKRCAVNRSTVFRWQASAKIPALVAWLVTLLEERRALAANLARPAE